MVSYTFCRPLSRIEARNRGNRDRPAATRDSHCTRKNTVPDDEVVDMMTEMMMWLP